MGTFVDYYSTVAGAVPQAANLNQNELAVNIADQVIYTLMPDNTVGVLSKYDPAGVTTQASDFSLHVPVAQMDICQWGVGLSQVDLSSRVVVDASGFRTTTYVPVYALGRKLWVPPVSCGVSSVGAYTLSLSLLTPSVSAAPLSSLQTNSGTLAAPTQSVTLVVYSDGQTYPWFYLPNSVNRSTSDPSFTYLYRISPFKTFGAIPVSQGPAAQAATSYWGTYP